VDAIVDEPAADIAHHSYRGQYYAAHSLFCDFRTQQEILPNKPSQKTRERIVEIGGELISSLAEDDIVFIDRLVLTLVELVNSFFLMIMIVGVLYLLGRGCWQLSGYA